MRIEKIPYSCLGTKTKHSATFSYQGVKYIKTIGANFCDEHRVGDLVEMKVLEGSSVILYPYESIKQELVMFVGVGILGVILLIRAVNYK